MSFSGRADPKGVSFLSLQSGVTKWQAIPDEVTELQPVVAGNTVAVLTDKLHTIKAFALDTGRPLWQKKDDTQILESDGRYFYVHGDSQTILEALNPETGDVVWSRPIPYSGYLIYSYHIHNGRFYTAEFVLDLSSRAIVHRWPARPLVNAIAFGREGRIYTGDPSGVVRIYNRNFKLLRRLRVGHGEIVELGITEKGMLAVSYTYRRSRIYHSVFRVVTQQGKIKWQLRWKWPRGDEVFPSVELAVAGQNVLLNEPDAAGDEFWVTARSLSTGRQNWRPAPLAGQMVICGDTAYVIDSESIHGLDLRTGKETMVGKPPHR